MFEHLQQALHRQPEKPEIVNISLANDVRLSLEALRRIDVDSMSDQELYQLCLNDCSRILENLLSEKETMKKLMRNPKFIINFSQAMYSIHLKEHEKIQICNTIYALRESLEKSVLILVNNLVKIINREIMPVVMNIGYTEDLAVEIMLARYSSHDSMKQVKRINRVLLTINEDIPMTIIVKTYETLGYLSHFTDLFEGIIYDKMNTFDLTEHQKEIYGSINMALLTIMEEMPFNLCYTLLLNFSETRYMRNQYSIRFNLNSCSPEDYPRINYTIDVLGKQGVRIPF